MERDTHPIVLFDGICNLCESTVQFIIRHDRDATFRFASLQSPVARQLLGHVRDERELLSSVLLVIDGKVYRKSRAALEICRRLDHAWPLLYYLTAWVPAPVSDRIYDYIGARRYRWFGKKDRCWAPSPELAARFLDAPDRASRQG